MEANKIRETFLRFFEERDHRRVPSSSLIPPPESGLMLTNAGMNQFIPYFLGQSEPPFRRAVSSQKCFRANDIENVGHTARHMTFFEMLGNFSFGDYFKAEASQWGFDLATEGYGIDPERIWVTVYETDDEAAEIWADHVGVPRERIVRRGKDDNYWWTHTAGPAGPCSEIYVDRGPKYGPEGGPAVDEERFIEIWNLVFMQEEVDGDANVVKPLPARNIDTGSGLERVAIVLQDVDNAFETDVFRPLLEVAESLSGKRHGQDERTDVSLKIVAEHARATAFLIADGVQPSNEGRGYVLRHMLRRVVSHARRLGIEGGVLHPLIAVVVEQMGGAYPELLENRAYVESVAESEEERFGATLRQGMILFEEALSHAEGPAQFSGDVAFRLHDTHGFPLELTVELAQEQGLDVDVDRFQELLEDQRRRAKEAVKRTEMTGDTVSEAAGRVGRTEFVGYERLDADTTVAAVLGPDGPVEAAAEGTPVRILLPVTPFYAEGGGQVGDTGTIRTATGLIRVTDTQPGPGGTHVHHGVVESGEIRPGDDAHAEVDRDAREATMRSHTATHVVHWTLRHLLGDHARQAGSLVAPGRLRFDFSHHSALGRDQLEEAEYTANSRLAADDSVRAYETTMDYAKSQGAIGLFGEKYGDIVRVVEIGDYSRELCGGTHVPHTGKIAVVRVLHEASIGAGMRRIEALVGPDALRHINQERRLLEEVVHALGGGAPESAAERARKAMERIKQLESELGRVRKVDRGSVVDALAGRAQRVDGVQLVVASVPGEDVNGIRQLAQTLRERFDAEGGGAAVLGIADARGAKITAAVTRSLADRGVTAKSLLDQAAKAIEGGVGGKDILATAGGSNAEALDDALGTIPARLAELLAGSPG
ncbi:MAG: alanine--tRNA ligase [Actinomycetota bacterium]